MATVSHLPHVLANVLVREAARGALARSPSACPRSAPAFATRPGSRAPTRRSGADIFAANREAVADEIDAVVERLARGGGADPRRRPRARSRAGTRPRARIAAGCSRPTSPAGDLRELRVGVENRPGTVAEIALALGHAQRQHRGHGALSGARHAHRRDLALGRRRATRPSAPRRSSASSATTSRRRRRRASDPLRARRARCAATLAPAARQVDLAPGGDRSRRWGRGRPRSPATSTPPTRARRSTAVAGGRRRRSGSQRGRRGRTLRAIAGVGLRGAGRRAIDVGNAGTLLRILPGLARRAAAAASGRSTATSRSAAGPSTGSPSRCG